MLSFHNLTAGYDRRPAVHHLNGHIEQGRMLAVIGPNGGGKSTLLKTIAGLNRPLSGKISLENPARIAYLPQTSTTDRSFPMTVLSFVNLGHWHECGAFKPVNGALQQKSLQALKQVGMQAFATRPIGALSIGQWQRVMFARLAVEEADILLLDEPFAALDAPTTAALLDLLGQWNKAGKTIIAVLHDLEMVQRVFPEALLLAREVIAWGDTAVVLTEHNLKHAALLAEEWQDETDICAA